VLCGTRTVGVFHEDYCGVSRLRRADGFCTGFHKHSQALASTRKQLQVSTLADYSTRIQSVGGATTGTGGLNMYASTIGLMPTVGVGIGVTVPTTALHTTGGTSLSGYPTNTIALFQAATSAGVNDAGVMIGSINGNTPYISDYSSASTGLNFYTSNALRLKIATNGNVGIGIGSPPWPLSVIGTNFSCITGTNVSSTLTIAGNYGNAGISQGISGGYIEGGTNYFTNTYMAFGTNGGATGSTKTERMRITDGGFVGIGTTNPIYPLSVFGLVSLNSSGYLFNSTGSSGTYTGANNITIYSQDSIVSAAFGFWALSDRRVKKDIQPISNCLSILKDFNPVQYKYIDNIKNKQSVQTGFIAQEVEIVYPFAVTVQENEEYLPTIYKKVCVEKITNGLRLHDTLSITDGVSVQVYDAVNKDYITTFHKSTQQLETSDVDKIVLTDNGEIFLYGTLVSDRKILEKDAIFTIGIGAIKELSEQNAALQSQLAAQSSAIAALEARLAAAGL